MANSPVVEVTGPHRAFIKEKMPAWIKHAHPSHIKRLRAGLFAGHQNEDPPEVFFTNASPWLREALVASQKRSRRAHAVLASMLAGLQGIAEFAEPKLIEGMARIHPSPVDVNKNCLFYLRPDKPAHGQTLLQAALLNFEGNERFSDSVGGAISAIAPVGALVTEKAGLTDEWVSGLTGGVESVVIKHEKVNSGSTAGNRYRYTEEIAVRPQMFAQLCRQLDLGQQYQAHLASVFNTPSTQSQLLKQMVLASKEQLAVRLYTALMTGEISAGDEMVREMLDSHPAPKKEPLVFSELEVFGFTLNHVLIIETGRSYPVREWADRHLGLELPVIGFDEPGADPVVVYIPGAPVSPLKEYPTLEAFKQELAINLRLPDYQAFFASLVPQGKAHEFLKRLNYQLLGKTLAPGSTESPVFVDSMSVNLSAARSTLPVLHGDIFNTLCIKQIERMKQDALVIAVPTALADWNRTQALIESCLSVGMNVLNLAAFFVPYLGEVMMAVMALQMAKQVYDGFEDWSVGDMDGAWSALESVALNVAAIGVMGAGGYAFSKIPAGTIPRLLKDVAKVTLPDGVVRLWRPELGPYQHPLGIIEHVEPNLLGQYEVNGKTYVRVGDYVYEQAYDQKLNSWKVKHPTSDTACEPRLEHNNAGAWRHSHERPLEWLRETLLRRLGPVTRSFNATTLARIGDISGVTDDVLRQIHMEGLPIPAVLLDTFELFRIDQELDALLLKIESAKGFDTFQDAVMQVLVEMPGWPEGQQLQVFEGKQLSGPYKLYGRIRSMRDPRPLVSLTRADIAEGEWSRRILSSLNNEQRFELLGEQNPLSPSESFSRLLAEALSKHRKNLFQRLSGPGRGLSPSPEIAVLRKRFPSLSERSAIEVLGDASNRERADMRANGKVSRSIDDRARIYIQQKRLSRAIAGLYRPSMATLDSERLALRGLEHLPGWSNNIRLKVIRANSSAGRMLDSIGLEQDPIHLTLVKKGDDFFIVDAAGAASSQPLNIFEAILQALPEQTREAMGFTGIGQGDDLQRALARHALANRLEAAQALGLRIPGSKPSLRVINGWAGYELSGKGEGVGVRDVQVVRLRDVYPLMSDEQALNYIEAWHEQGITNQHIFDTLEQQLNELHQLCSTLQSWSAEGTFRSNIVERIISCWRSGLPYNHEFDISLDLGAVTQLPIWEANFSHVRALTMDAALLCSEPQTGFLSRFPNVRKLELSVRQETLQRLTEHLPALEGITELSVTLEGDGIFTRPFLDAFSALSALEKIALRGGIDRLDVSRMSELYELNVFGSLAQWPEGVFELEKLVVLDLQYTSITTLPEGFFGYFRRVQPAIRLNWSAMDLQTVIRAHEFFSSAPDDAVEASELVSSFVRARLSAAISPVMAPQLIESLTLRAVRSTTPVLSLTRASELYEEGQTLVAQLEGWISQNARRLNVDSRQRVADRILDCWRKGLGERFDPGSVDVSLDINEGGQRLDLAFVELKDLPVLNANGFTHVKSLRLSEVNAPVDEMNSFLTLFKSAQEVAIIRCHLFDLPTALADMVQLKSLDISYNELFMTPRMQQQLNRMGALEQLNLSGNWVGELDVGSLHGLRELDVGRTAIKQWPTGLLERRSLQTLDLSFCAITDIPQGVIDHPVLLGKTQLNGCPLSRQSCHELLIYALKNQRNSAGGITVQMLSEGVTGGVPEYYPPHASDNSALLLPEPLGVMHTDVPLTRLQRLVPELTPAQAMARIAQLQADVVAVGVRIEGWEQELQTLTARLNTWISSRSYRVGNGRNWVSATDRRAAADRILQAWRYGVGQSGAEVFSLDLSNLSIGDMPELPGVFAHVTTLNMSRTGLTASGADSFLHRFTRLQTLQLDRSDLFGLPEYVETLQSLTRLDAAGNRLASINVQSLQALQTLNLSHNAINAIDVSGLSHLRTLDMGFNALSDWPEGVFDLPDLSALNLQDNEIEEVPFHAFKTEHNLLMAGTTVAGNPLARSEMWELRAYRDRTGNSLGFSSEDFDSDEDTEHSDVDTGTDEDSNADEDVSYVLPGPEALAAEKQPWFENVPADSDKHMTWEVLRRRSDAAYFFRLLASLQESSDFLTVRAELIQRVWVVLEAANENEELCEELFVMARSRDTCGDGRTLVFGDIELKVYEFTAFGSGGVGKTGAQLFRFYRGMFRLGKVEAIAGATVDATARVDIAEVRLAYRLELKDRLDLPKQPQSMLYRDHAPQVTPTAVEAAYEQVIAAEKTAEFLEQLITREGWLNYLKEQYPQAFTQLDLYKDRENLKLHNRHSGDITEVVSDTGEVLEGHEPTDKNISYEEDANMVSINITTEENQLLLRLSELERQRFEKN